MGAKVYVETSVISYLASRPNRDLVIAANQQTTSEWWVERRSSYELYISQLVVQEADSGDADAVERRRRILETIPLLEISEKAAKLAEQLVQKGAVPQVAVEDALHIAVATVNGMAYLLTWNFRHIANATLRSKIEAICRNEGYEPPVICSPQELLEE
ncbi:MAG: type II toxin-antitoxin system VapC family toxin [Caldilineaceae bacterium]|nr:type II toxin-antitoxin system VapC family toxin [Caldilineaceae bacterium]